MIRKLNRCFVVVVLITLLMWSADQILGAGPDSAVASGSSIRACGGGSFWGAWVGKNGATGTNIYELAFINRGHTSCHLGGYPTVLGYRDGRGYALKAGHLNGKLFDLSPTVVGPRMSGEMVLTTRNDCNALNTGSRRQIEKVIDDNSYEVSINFPHSTAAVIVYGLDVDVACGLNITELGWT
jgi:hypothetical protein